MQIDLVYHRSCAQSNDSHWSVTVLFVFFNHEIYCLRPTFTRLDTIVLDLSYVERTTAAVLEYGAVLATTKH